MSSNILSLLSQDAIYAVLHRLPIIDLVLFCSSCKETYSILRDPCYFQQRLVYFNLSHLIFIKLSAISPVDRYVLTLVQEDPDLIVDPSVIEYISRTDLLPPTPDFNIERYIGLGRLGERAVRCSNKEIVAHVLDNHPVPNDINPTIDLLKKLYWESKMNLTPFTLCPDKYEQMLLDQFTHPFERYHPESIDDAKFYSLGVSGQNIDASHLSVKEMFPYMYGLIDGGHDDIAYVNFIESDVSIDDSVVWTLLFYIGIFGSIRLMDLLKSKFQYCSMQLFEVSVASDDRDHVKWYLDNYFDRVYDAPIYPTSKSMITLLLSYKIDISDCHILVGALRSGNYRLLNSLNRLNRLNSLNPSHIGTELMRITIEEVCERTPPYMIEMLFSKILKDSTDDKTKSAKNGLSSGSDKSPRLIIMNRLLHRFSWKGDPHRVEALLKIGGHLSSKLINEWKSKMEDLSRSCPLLWGILSKK